MVSEEPQFLLLVAPLPLGMPKSPSGYPAFGPQKREEAGSWGDLPGARRGGEAAHTARYNCCQALTPNCKVGTEEAVRLFPIREQKQSKTPKWSGLARSS